MRWAKEHPGEALEEAFPVARMPNERIGETAAIVTLDQAIAALDEQRRMAIELRWRAGMSSIELGNALRMAPSAAERLADDAEEQVQRALP